MNKIIVSNVGKTIEEQVILRNINIKLQSGKVYGLIGRNGSGKTVLLKCIAGFLTPTTGEIKVNEKVLGKDIKFPENMGFIINAPGFLPEMSGIKNLQYLAAIKQVADKEKIVEAMNMVGLDPKSKKRVGKYSTGMKQRLGIAQAIMEDPEILILDEPMNGLDDQMVEKIRGVVLELKKRGKLIIITSHNREDIEILCDEVYKMKDGELESVR